MASLQSGTTWIGTNPNTAILGPFLLIYDLGGQWKKMPKPLRKRRKPPKPIDLYASKEIKCPHCGNLEVIDHYDVGGMDEGFIFCNKCNRDFKFTGKTNA